MCATALVLDVTTALLFIFATADWSTSDLNQSWKGSDLIGSHAQALFTQTSPPNRCELARLQRASMGLCAPCLCADFGELRPASIIISEPHVALPSTCIDALLPYASRCCQAAPRSRFGSAGLTQPPSGRRTRSRSCRDRPSTRAMLLLCRRRSWRLAKGQTKGRTANAGRGGQRGRHPKSPRPRRATAGLERFEDLFTPRLLDLSISFDVVAFLSLHFSPSRFTLSPSSLTSSLARSLALTGIRTCMPAANL